MDMSFNARAANGVTLVGSRVLAVRTAEYDNLYTAGLSLMSSETPTPGAAPPVVDTEDGPVTASSIDYLRQTATDKQRAAKALTDRIADLKSQTLRAQIQAGSILSARRSEWASADRAPRIEAALGLEQLVARLDQNVAEVAMHPHHGLGGLVQSFKDRHETDSLHSQLRSAKAELDTRYGAVADLLDGPTGIADADSLLDQVRQNLQQQRDLSAQQETVGAEIGRLTDEIKRREDAIATLGFDGLGVQADLVAHGIRPIATSLVLKKNEVAAASAQATLCRYRTSTRYVGGSQGVSIPIGLGLRYRVSSFRGHPVQSEALSPVDQGTLVVTNQRLVFLGSKRDVSIPIAKLLQVEAFSNALGIAREGKEAREIYLVPQPAYLVLFIHWVVSHQS